MNPKKFDSLFNGYFTSIGAKLASEFILKLTSDCENFTLYLGNTTKNKLPDNSEIKYSSCHDGGFIFFA